MKKQIFYRSYTFLKNRIKFVVYSLFFKSDIHVYGDSHTQIFSYINKNELKYKKFVVNRVDGATAMGMVNPNSKTNALPTFIKEIDKIPKNSTILFLLGEVDCGFLIWHRNKVTGLDVDDQLKKSIENYTTFLKGIIEKGYKNIFVISSTLPTVKDENVNIQEVELRRQIDVSLSLRTQLSLRYNIELKNICVNNKIGFIDLDKDMYDDKLEILKTEYLDENPAEHHLNQKTYSKLLVLNLKKHKLL